MNGRTILAVLQGRANLVSGPTCGLYWPERLAGSWRAPERRGHALVATPTLHPDHVAGNGSRRKGPAVFSQRDPAM